jgi:hypothetical protein
MESNGMIQHLRKLCGVAALFGFLGCFAGLEGRAQSASPEALFEQANRAYEQGKFAEAIQTYSLLVQSGRTSPAIYFNLGNACFKAGRIGDALGHYLIAERLAPRDPDLQANIRFVRSAFYGNAPPERRLPGRWLGRLSLNEWTVLFAVGLWAFFGLLSLRLLRPNFRQVSRAWLRVVLFSLLVFGAGVVSSCLDRFSVQQAVVNHRDVILRHGPVTESPSLQTMADGQELRVLDTKNDWLQVSGASRGTGWVRQQDVWLLPR